WTIVNVAWVRSVTSVGKTTQYDTTKAAVAGLTRGMAVDHAADRIRVNAVCPGPIFTPFHEKRTRELGRTLEQYREDAAKSTILKRPGTPEEVATARASARATTVWATTRLFISLTACPAPTGPQWVISLPMHARYGFSRSNTAVSPPTMIDSVPSFAAWAVRATGASAKSAPRAANA